MGHESVSSCFVALPLNLKPVTAGASDKIEELARLLFKNIHS